MEIVIITYLFTYLLHAAVLLQKLTGSEASQEISRIFGTRRFLTVPTSARHLSLSWSNSIQSPQITSVASQKRSLFNSDTSRGKNLPSECIPKTTKDVSAHIFIYSGNSCKLYQRIPGNFRSYYYIQMLGSWRVRTRGGMGKQGEEKWNPDTIWERKLEGKDHLEDLGVDGKLQKSI